MSTGADSPQSNACLGVLVDFYWRGGGDATQEEHIALAVEALMSALKAQPYRLWNPYNERLIRAEFKNTLLKAVEGKLQPPGEIKALRGGDILFEIRWTDINVHERPPAGPDRHTKSEVRLIHAQPYAELGLCVLGLHAHEKKIIPDDARATKNLQDDQIDIAERIFHSERSTHWGVQRREQHGHGLLTHSTKS
nr:hypothetical protein [Actinomyces sp.]